MLANLYLHQSLMKAKSHIKKGEFDKKTYHFHDFNHYNNIKDLDAFSTNLYMFQSTKSKMSKFLEEIGTIFKFPHWRLRYWNNILFILKDLSLNINKKDSREVWKKIFFFIAQNFLKLTKNWRC